MTNPAAAAQAAWPMLAAIRRDSYRVKGPVIARRVGSSSKSIWEMSAAMACGTTEYPAPSERMSVEEYAGTRHRQSSCRRPGSRGVFERSGRVQKPPIHARLTNLSTIPASAPPADRPAGIDCLSASHLQRSGHSGRPGPAARDARQRICITPPVRLMRGYVLCRHRYGDAASSSPAVSVSLSCAAVASPDSPTPSSRPCSARTRSTSARTSSVTSLLAAAWRAASASSSV
jgi:hypothetical protein